MSANVRHLRPRLASGCVCAECAPPRPPMEVSKVETRRLYTRDNKGRNPFAVLAAAPPTGQRVSGMCTACGAIEVYLDRIDGFKDYSSIGESDRYPVGYGCEACS